MLCSTPFPNNGLIKDLKFSLETFYNVSFLVDVVVINIPDVLRMFLSGEWDATLGGSLQMGLSYTTIHHPKGGFFTLY
jgi:hypothetical protein